MGDDLVKRLRVRWDWSDDEGTINDKIDQRAEAADRIEALRDEMLELRADKEAAEAKVAKVKDHLVRIQDLTQHNMPMTAGDEQCVNREACAALAALGEGGDDT